MVTKVRVGNSSDLEVKDVEYNPCPFCGADAPAILITEDGHGFEFPVTGKQVVCISCGARGPVGYRYDSKCEELKNMNDEEVALHYWNTRNGKE